VPLVCTEDYTYSCSNKVIALCLKNAPCLASCNLNKQRLILMIFGKQHLHTFKNDLHIHFSLSLYFYLLYLVLNRKWHVLPSFYARETVQLLQQETSDFTSSDLCPSNSPDDPETRWTTEFGDWWRNLCTLYKTHVHNTSDFMQRINDTWANISQNVEAVGQWRKQLCACIKAKEHHIEHLLN